MTVRLSRTVVRFPKDDKEALDRLRSRYFEETGKWLSRAAVVRALVHQALAGADERKATEALREPEIAVSSIRAYTPPRRVEIEVQS